MTDLAIHRLDLATDELDGVVELVGACFPRLAPMLPQFLHWLYMENPEGEAIAFGAWAGASLVAHVALVPMHVSWQGIEVVAGLLANVAVDPAHRRQGLMTRLAFEALDASRRNGWHHAVVVANRRSTPLFLKRLHFRCVGPLEVFLSVAGKSEPQLGRGPWHRIWGEPSLAWRLARPGASYRLQPLNEKTVVLARSWWPFEVVMGLVQAEFLRNWRSGSFKPSLLHVWVGLGWRMQKRWPLLFPLPPALRPSPLNLCFFPLQGKATPRREEVCMLPLDFDAF